MNPYLLDFKVVIFLGRVPGRGEGEAKNIAREADTSLLLSLMSLENNFCSHSFKFTSFALVNFLKFSKKSREISGKIVDNVTVSK